MSKFAPQAIDPAMRGAYVRALARRGQAVTVQRITGTAPRTVTFSATVTALVEDDPPDTNDVRITGYGATKPGAISQTSRSVTLMASDLASARFPVPVQKNDKIILSSTGEKLNVTEVDMHKRALAGAVTLTGVGVA